MSIQYDPRLQGKQNKTDILSGQEGSQDAQAPSEQPQPVANNQGAPAPQEASQSNLATKKPKASSGMFTNVQNYIEKNKPATQQMAGAASKKFTNTSDIIKKQMGSALQRYSGNIQNKQKEIEKLRGIGQTQVDQIVNPTTPPPTGEPQQLIAPTQDQVGRGIRTASTYGQTAKSGQVQDKNGNFVFHAPYRPTLFSSEHRDYAQKDFLGDKYDQYRADMDNALSNFTAGDDKSLENLSKIEESYGLTGNWFDQYKDIDPSTYRQYRIGDADKTAPRPSPVPEEQNTQPSFDQLGSMAKEIGEGTQLINVNPQLTAAERLRNQAQAVDTEQGRRQILRDVFGANKQYTQGAQSLDNLLISGSPEASERLSQDVRQAGMSAFNEVDQGKRQAQDAFRKLQYGASNLGSNLENYRQSAIEGLQADAASQREQFIADRAAEIQREQDEARAAIEAMQGSQAGGAFKDLNSFANALNQYTNRGYVFRGAFDQTDIRPVTGTKWVSQGAGGSRRKKIYGKPTDHLSARVKLDADAFDQLANQYKLSDLGINTDDIRNKFWEGARRAGTNRNSRRIRQSSAQAALDMINERLSGINSEDMIRSKMEKKYGGNIDDILAGKDLQEDQSYGFEQSQIDRINKLKELQNEQDLIQTRDYLDKDEVSGFDAFDRIINRYKK
jgi:hypothetical protein